MKILVRVKPSAKTSEVVKINEGQYRAKVKAPPKENKANVELINAISEYFNVPQAQIHILKGLKSKTKLIEVIVKQVSVNRGGAH